MISDKCTKVHMCLVPLLSSMIEHDRDSIRAKECHQPYLPHFDNQSNLARNDGSYFTL